MADEMLSEKTEQTNPVFTDNIYLINYTGVADPETGSLWQTLRLGLTALYNLFFNTARNAGIVNKITTYTFAAADYYTHEPAQYEMILFINARFTTATTIKVGTLTDPEAYISETTNTSTNPNVYCDSANVSDRSINIALNGSGTITIISILNV